MRIVSPGQAVFAATLTALGLMGLVTGDFTPVWEPVPKGLPAREVLIYVCALISLTSGLGLLVRPMAAAATRMLLGSLLAWWFIFRVSALVSAPSSPGAWYAVAELAVVVSAAWVLYTWFARSWDRQHLGFATGDNGLRAARILYGGAMIPFGVGHFIYLRETAAMVPGWLPFHIAWAYFTGAAYLAAGFAILIGGNSKLARLAASLSALQMGLFTLLVWVPIMAAGSKDAFQRSETILSAALTAAAWVLVDSYRVAVPAVPPNRDGTTVGNHRQ